MLSVSDVDRAVTALRGLGFRTAGGPMAAMERRLARRLIESDRRLAALATAARMSGPHS